jgi:hypothetical protein
MDRRALTRRWHRRGVARAQPEPVGQAAQQMHPDQRDHLPVADGHLHPLGRPSSVHFASALLVGLLMAWRTFTIPCQKGTCADAQPSHPSHPVNDRG